MVTLVCLLREFDAIGILLAILGSVCFLLLWMVLAPSSTRFSRTLMIHGASFRPCANVRSVGLVVAVIMLLHTAFATVGKAGTVSRVSMPIVACEWKCRMANLAGKRLVIDQRGIAVAECTDFHAAFADVDKSTTGARRPMPILRGEWKGNTTDTAGKRLMGHRRATSRQVEVVPKVSARPASFGTLAFGLEFPRPRLVV